MSSLARRPRAAPSRSRWGDARRDRAPASRGTGSSSACPDWRGRSSPISSLRLSVRAASSVTATPAHCTAAADPPPRSCQCDTTCLAAASSSCVHARNRMLARMTYSARSASTPTRARSRCLSARAREHAVVQREGGEQRDVDRAVAATATCRPARPHRIAGDRPCHPSRARRGRAGRQSTCKARTSVELL